MCRLVDLHGTSSARPVTGLLQMWQLAPVPCPLLQRSPPSFNRCILRVCARNASERVAYSHSSANTNACFDKAAEFGLDTQMYMRGTEIIIIIWGFFFR